MSDHTKRETNITKTLYIYVDSRKQVKDIVISMSRSYKKTVYRNWIDVPSFEHDIMSDFADGDGALLCGVQEFRDLTPMFLKLYLGFEQVHVLDTDFESMLNEKVFVEVNKRRKQ